MMFEAKRLHPVSAVINFVKGLKDAIFPLIAIVLLNGNVFSGEINWIAFSVTAGVLLLTLAAGIIRWLRFTYRIEEGELRIEFGLLLKKKRYIPIERIQSLNFSEGVLHRPFQLVKVAVETAGTSGIKGAEAELTAIKKNEANELEALIYEYKGKKKEFPEEEHEPEEVQRKEVYEMNNNKLILLAITSGGAGVVLSGVGVFFSQFMDILPLDTIYREVLAWVKVGAILVAIAVFVVLLVAYGIAILLTVFRYANFKVSLYEGDLIITRGLLEKKQLTIPLNRIQGIRIDENLIRQPFGYASVTIISAGGTFGKEMEHKMLLMPFIKKNQIALVMEKIFENYTIQQEFHKPPKRSIVPYLLYSSGIFWVASIPVSIIFFPYGLLSLAVGIVFTFLGWLDFRTAGWNLTGKQLTIQGRAISKQTYVMMKRRIQSASLHQTFFQKKDGLATIEVTLKSGVGGAGVKCRYMNEEEAVRILKWFKPRQ